MNNVVRLRTVFALTGAPACAKGTGVKLVFQDFCNRAGIKMAVVPVSQHLKNYVDGLEDRNLAEKILGDMSSGRLVDDHITNTVFESAVDEIASTFNEVTSEPVMIVLDGSPRTVGQIQPSIFAVTNKLGVSVSGLHFVHVNTPPHICAYRMGSRGRNDDMLESVVATRFDEFFAKTLPAIGLLKDFAKTSSAKFHQIDGQRMRDYAYSYQRKLFSPLWPEFFPGQI